VAHALEAAHHESLRFPHAAHFTIAALADDDAEPRMALAAADHGELLEARRAVLEFDAALQPLERFVGHLAVDAADVLAFDLGARMHERMRERAVGREQQKARGVDVEPAHRDPSRTLEPRQMFEHGRTALRIVARRYHA